MQMPGLGEDCLLAPRVPDVELGKNMYVRLGFAEYEL